MTLVLSNLTSSFHLLQYCSKIDIQFCKPSSDSDIMSKSSAYNKQFILISSIKTGLQSSSKLSDRSLIKTLQSRGLNPSPCLTPLKENLAGPNLLSALNQNFVLEYILLLNL